MIEVLRPAVRPDSSPIILIALALSLPVQSAKAQVNQQDSLALVAIYNATNGSAWTNNSNWLTAPVEQWSRVSVTGNRVTGLTLYNNGLTGSIPPEIGDLTELEVLDLQSNQLTGTLPPQLGGLPALRSLTLHNNQLSGSIPPDLGTLAELRFLWLFGNQLTGTIPTELANLTNLIELYLDDNQLSGVIPPELGGLDSLRYLTLTNNQLSGNIPPELGGLTELRALWLYFNQLTGGIPPELGNLTNLTILDVHSNPLSGELPRELTSLSMLTLFDFSGTGLCEPTDTAFQNWLQAIADVRRSGCTTGVEEIMAGVPTEFTLGPNFPNPFNPRTTIRFALPQSAPIRLVVYDAMGRQIRLLAHGIREPGWHTVVFDSDALPGGVYFYRLVAPTFGATGRMVLIK